MATALPLIFGCTGTEKTLTPAESLPAQPSAIVTISEPMEPDMPAGISENKYFIEQQNEYAGSGYEPELTLHPDGTFMFLVNLFAGMANVYGTYELNGDVYTFHVSERNFGGFAGDDVDEFKMMISGDRLIYLNDDMIGVTNTGSVFYPVK